VEHRESAATAAVVRLVTEQPGIVKRSLEPMVKLAVRCSTEAARDGIAAAVVGGGIHLHRGSNNRQLHYPGKACSGGCEPL
jgi:hypothetical protein